jgi:hypothetical protein
VERAQTPLVDRPAVFHLEEATFFKALTQTAKVADDSQGFIGSRLLLQEYTQQIARHG